MDTTLLIVLVALVAVLALASAFWLIGSRKRSQELQKRFGPEYDKTLEEAGGRRDAEKVLQERSERVEKLRLRELLQEERGRFSQDWRQVQGDFVDAPGEANSKADRLVQEVMNARGYPMTDFDQQAADISVDHPEVVTNYRAAHDIAQAHEREGVSTEDLRQAMLHYRALFADLLGAGEETLQRRTG